MALSFVGWATGRPAGDRAPGSEGRPPGLLGLGLWHSVTKLPTGTSPQLEGLALWAHMFCLEGGGVAERAGGSQGLRAQESTPRPPQPLSWGSPHSDLPFLRGLLFCFRVPSPTPAQPSKDKETGGKGPGLRGAGHPLQVSRQNLR